MKALKREGTHTPQDIQDAIERGAMQAFQRGDTVVITTLRQFPQLKACEIILAAGDYDDVWWIHDNQVEPWARKMGCTRMMGSGRMGWTTSAAERGYGNETLMMRKELT